MSEVPEEKKRPGVIKEMKPRKTRPNSKLKKGKDSLPWWVEILFVQIGLPEKLLLNLLNIKKSVKNTINDNRENSKLIVILLVIIFYSLPFFNQAKNMNNCIRERSLLLKDRGIEKSERITSSVHYCNGGNSTYD